MKVINCYNCGSEENTFYAEENGFSLNKCCKCGLIYVQERPDDNQITQAHKQGKHTGLKELDVTGSFNSSKVSRYLEILKDLFNGSIRDKKSWLDVGCGHGELLVAVQNFSHGSIEVKGSEPNIHKRNQAKIRGLNVEYFDIETHADRYDIISILNVWSHLPDPPQFLQALKRLLKPHGELIIQTGDTAQFAPEEHYRPFYLPDHLSFASEKIVSDILRRLDFEILKICKYPYLPIKPATIMKEIIKIFLPQYFSRIHYFLKWNRYAETDMFIRARLKA